MNGHGPWIFLAGAAVALTAGWLGVPRAFYREMPQPLQYSHKVHTGEAVGLSCGDCHAFTEDGRFTGIPSVRRCAECHQEALGESESEKILIEAYVRKEAEIPWLVYSRQPDNVYFSHVQHVKKAGLDCAACHGDHGSSEGLRPYGVNRLSGYSRDLSGAGVLAARASPARGLRMDDCIDCHAREGAPETCITCHK